MNEANITLQKKDAALVFREDGSMEVYVPDETEGLDAPAEMPVLLVTALAIRIEKDPDFMQSIMEGLVTELDEFSKKLEGTDDPLQGKDD